MPRFCQNAVFRRVFSQKVLILPFFYVFQNNSSFFINTNGVIPTQNIYFCYCCQSLYALLLTGSIGDRDVVVKICILMLHSDKILQMKALHYM